MGFYPTLEAFLCGLRQANMTLEQQVDALSGQLQTALARIAELEQGRKEHLKQLVGHLACSHPANLGSANPWMSV